ncbi:MAG TPA: glycosyltransferase [Candidatus Binatia bacterium]|nr:glycosyltransferase [Candidatus Binatia bacterium]
MLSIIIPTYNERDNLSDLIKRLVRPLNYKRLEYELVFIDDHSTDGTFEYLQELKEILPIQVYRKIGKRGKAQSLLQGFLESHGDVLAFIDADLQYPPEAIPKMMKQLQHFDIVIGKRQHEHGFWLRDKLTKIFNFFFGKVLLGLDYDVQSGLKVFKRDVLHNLHLSPSKWGFDYEFLFKAKRMGWRIGQQSINFSVRKNGQSNVGVMTAFELAWGALKLRLKYMVRSVLKFLDYPHPSERHPVNYKNKDDFLFVPEIHSSKKHWYAENISLLIVASLSVVAFIGGVSYLTGWSPIIVISGLIAIFYIVLMLFKFRMIYHATNRTFVEITDEEIAAIKDEELPVITILIPLNKEAEVIGQIKKAMTSLDYPAEKLDAIITLEHYDHETIQAIDRAYFPPHFKKLILPDVKPKTKPKCLNVALPHAKGEFLVIYDAEIMPDPDQLKKAYLAFKKHPDVSALQTRLDHYNPDQSVITRLFNEEFSFHFDMMLPGLQKMGYPLPLAGHSVIFRTEVLREVGGWDPYNVTEDADMGIRLARAGKKIEILDSYSREEATTSMITWVKQRTRWIKGFIQTTMVHMRHPFRFKKELGLGWGGFMAFLITVPASVAINIMNLGFWALLIGWFATESELIKSLFPGPIYYASLTTFLVGNFTFIYLNMVSSYNRQRYSLVAYGLLSPFYWMLLAVASVRAAIEFVVKPHHWDKTTHGVHLNKKEDEEVVIKRYVIPSNS